MVETEEINQLQKISNIPPVMSLRSIYVRTHMYVEQMDDMMMTDYWIWGRSLNLH